MADNSELSGAFWLLDSGASCHFTGDIGNFASVKSGSTPVGGPVKSGRKRTKEESRGLDKRLVRLELVTTWIQRLRITSIDPLRRFRSR